MADSVNRDQPFVQRQELAVKYTVKPFGLAISNLSFVLDGVIETLKNEIDNPQAQAKLLSLRAILRGGR